MDFKIGDKVRITGCGADFTDHLDGKLGEVVSVRSNDIGVIVEGDDKSLPWYIWKDNAEVIKEEKKVFTKKDIKTGMFGVMDNDKKFVVVNDLLVYEGGGYDTLDQMNEDLGFGFYKINKIYSNCKSFGMLNDILKGRHYATKCVYDRERDTKPALYNGKVVCVDAGVNGGLYTVGKIYQFKDGQLTADNGNIFPQHWDVRTFEDWSNWTGSKFIEIKE